MALPREVAWQQARKRQETIENLSLAPPPNASVNLERLQLHQESTTRTISRNETEGQEAKEEALLRVALSSSGVPNGMVRTVATTVPVQSTWPPTAPAFEQAASGCAPAPENRTPQNHALQDYQMQMMLLEQQNKKRLLMARQEQDSTSHAGVSAAQPHSTFPITTKAPSQVRIMAKTKSPNFRSLQQQEWQQQQQQQQQQQRQKQHLISALGLSKQACLSLAATDPERIDTLLSTVAPGRSQDDDSSQVAGGIETSLSRICAMKEKLPSAQAISSADPSGGPQTPWVAHDQIAGNFARHVSSGPGSRTMVDFSVKTPPEACPSSENRHGVSCDTANGHPAIAACIPPREPRRSDGLRLNQPTADQQAQIDRLKAENALLRLALGKPDTAEDWPVLHRVRCSRDNTVMTYTTAPMLDGKTDEDHEHLDGHQRIANESVWEDRMEDTPFVVYLTYECPNQRDKNRRRKNHDRRNKSKSAEDTLRPVSEEVHILSEDLLDTLREFFSWTPGLRAYQDAGILSDDILTAPYPFAYHFHSRFDQHSASLNGVLKADFDIFTSYVRRDTEKDGNSIHATLCSGLTTPELMPFLFTPDSLLIVPGSSDSPAQIMRQTSILRPKNPVTLARDDTRRYDKRKVAPLEWRLDATSVQFDGKFWQIENHIDISLKPNERTTITDLDVYPLRFAKHGVKEHLLSRGKKFYSFRNGQYIDSLKDADEAQGVATARRHMVDVHAFETLHSGDHFRTHLETLSFVYLARSGKRELLVPTPQDEDFLLQLPGSISAFHMDEKKWVTLKLDEIADDIQWNKEAFESLVIEPDAKEIVEALVQNKIESDKGIDFVKGKGTGLIILLHGGPGTGKTLTAESVAEIAEKPLYRVTCGDIGIDPVKVENYLESVFYLGRRWKSVVLLDEADVFLQQRDLNNLARNTLVSVFLRSLEYYDGILVLTSNRVGTFDEAFKSRIQLALYYPNLNDKQRAQIWTNFVNRLATFEDAVDIDTIRGQIGKLSQFPMNGRQIRNAINNARGLAKSKGQSMTVEHLNRVIGVSLRFEEYLVEMKGAPDDDFLLDQGVRWDAQFGPKGSP